MSKIGITERGDAALNLTWIPFIEHNPAVLISKDPVKLFNVISNLPKIPNIIVHCTITGLGYSDLEPNVPKLEDSIEGYNKLIEFLGSERVVLRIDPIIPTKEGVEKAKKVLAHAKTRVRISFLDNYEHVKARFKLAQIKPLDYYFHAPLNTRELFYNELKAIYSEIEVCGEPGFEDVGCISELDAKILGVTSNKTSSCQRKSCNCISNKFELLTARSQCYHKCLYCYWKS
jgi:hypothetical protein